MSLLMNQIYQNALNHPEKIAIICETEKVTYKELIFEIGKYASIMKENGISYGDHIGFPMNNSIESVIVMLSAGFIGASIVPFSPSMPLEAVITTINTSNIKHIIARENFLKRNKINVEGKILCLEKEFLCSAKSIQQLKLSSPNFDLTGEESFIITMTSGSTGNPKPIVLTQNNKLKRVKSHIKLYNLANSDIVLTATPMYHSLAERLVLIPLFLGGTSVVLQNFTPDKWISSINKYKVTFTIAVSTQLYQVNKLLIEQPKLIGELTSLKKVVSSSSLLEEDVKTSLINNLNSEFHEMYGSSEISTATSISFNESTEKKQSVGKPIDDCHIKIFDEKGKECGVNKIGEIACNTDLIASGYFNKMDIFKMNFIDRYFKTGDLGYLDEDGYLYFCGRKKEVIITGGINVYPQDIERVVSRIEGIDECVAFAEKHETLGESVAIAVVGNANLKRVIQKECAKSLIDYQQPFKIYFVDSIPKNTMGKVMRYKLKDDLGEKNGN